VYIEKRRIGRSIKYYLVYSYREKGTVKKIRRYLGMNLSEEGLNKSQLEAGKQIKLELERLNTAVFDFKLSKKQIERLNRYEKKVNVYHLRGWDWQQFTENFTYNTNAIEGSTVQLGEVPLILHKKKVANAEEMETRGVASAVGFIRSTNEDLSLKLIKKLHNLCFQGSKPFAGEFRNVEVVIKDGKGEIVHRGVPLSQLEYKLKDLIEWYRKNKNKFKPLVLSAIIHNQFEHIHPFQDGNGRVGRLLLNFILLKNKYPPINISLEDRAEYYQTLQEYHKNQTLAPSMRFLVKQYKKTLRQVTTKRKN